MNARLQALVFFTTLCSLFSTPGSSQEIDSSLSSKSRSLRDKAQLSKHAGINRVDLGTFTGVPPHVPTLEAATKDFSVFIIAPLVSETVIENDRDILTWYRAKILTRISTGPTSELAPSLADLPTGIVPHSLPTNDDEILLLQHGGTITIEGVTFTKQATGFPPLAIGKKYFCILSLSVDNRVAISPLGGSGVFEADTDTLRAVGGKDHPLVEDIKASYRNSLTDVSRRVRNTSPNK